MLRSGVMGNAYMGRSCCELCAAVQWQTGTSYMSPNQPGVVRLHKCTRGLAGINGNGLCCASTSAKTQAASCSQDPFQVQLIMQQTLSSSGSYRW
jgi:hypothetical protein